jgi:hypothetical protein
VRLRAGLTRAQVDTALEDLASGGQVVLTVRHGRVVAEAPPKADAEAGKTEGGVA